MRRSSRLYDAAIDTVIRQTTAHQHAHYVCRRCLRNGTASRLSTSTPSAHFSTTTSKTAGLGLDKFSSAMKGETSLFDEQPQEKADDFKPAETWEGLEWVGTKQWYERQKRPHQPFQGYGRMTAPLKDRMRIRDELLKSVVEVFTLRRAAPTVWKQLLGRATVEGTERFAMGIRLGCDPKTKEPVFEFETSEAEQQFLNQIQRTIGIRSESADGASPQGETSIIEGSLETSDTPATHSTTFTFADLTDQTYGKWSSIDLEDLEIRFAVAKRVQQRTGLRLTDPQLTHANTAGAMFLHLWKPEKPKKLAESLLSNDDLANLPNVKIADHRVSFVHRERDVGRWKVIEEELTDRGIPSLGRPGYKKRSAKV